MYFSLYEKSLGAPLEKTGLTAWNIVNDNGQISIVEKECFISKDSIAQGLAIIKMEGRDNNHDILGFPPKELCQHIDLNINKSFDTSFVHFDKDVLKQEWNKQVDVLKLSKESPVYLYGMKINDFSEFLDFIKKNVSNSFDKICIKAMKDDIIINIYIEEDEELDFSEIEFHLREEEAPTIKPFANYLEWDEGLDGSISLEKLNEYLRTFGGIDLINSSLYLIEQRTEEDLKTSEESIKNVQNDAAQKFLMLDFFMKGKGFNEINLCLLPLLTNFSGRYVYELFVDRKIIAYEIIDEDDDFWYTENGKFAKNNILEIPQFNPNRFDTIYSDNLDKLINAFNNNLEKFYIS